MALYTYNDFMKAAEQSGLLGQFSQADIKLAQNNPDVGMKILGYKQDWKSAASDEARALSHEATEKLRADYGDYSGGASGSQYILLSQPKTVQTPAPAYSDPYAGQLTGALNDVVNYPDFTYDPDTDPNMANARKAYRREGQRATADVLGQIAAGSGGQLSSYAVTAASQANDNYMAQLSDEERDIYNQAYQQYLDKYKIKQSNLGALQGVSDTAYGRYADQRDFGYNQDQQGFNNALNLWSAYGAATPDIAAALGVPLGSLTSDQAYRELMTSQNNTPPAQATGGGTSGTNGTGGTGGGGTPKYTLNGKTLTDDQYTSYTALKNGSYTAADFSAIVKSGAYTADQLTAQGFSPNGSGAGNVKPTLTWEEAKTRFTAIGRDINKYAVTQSEFNASTTMKQQYGTYGQYLAAVVSKNATAASFGLSSKAQEAKEEAKRRILMNGASGEDIADYLGALVDVYQQITDTEAEQIMKELSLI